MTQPVSEVVNDVTGQTAPPQASAPEQTPKETKVPEQDDSFAKMAHLEKQKRMLDKQYKTEKAAWEAEKAQLLQKSQTPDNSWKDKVKQDLIGTLAEAGLTYDEVLNTYVNHTPMDQNMRMLQSKIKEMEETQTKLMNQLTDTEKKNYDSALKQIKTEVKQLVKASPEDYEVINSQGEMAEEAVVRLIEATYKEDGYLMDVEEAAKQVEDYMLENSLNLAKLKKVQQKLTPTQQAAQGEVKQTITQTKAPTTLSHNMQPQSKPMTNKERYERAILAFQGKLNT